MPKLDTWVGVGSLFLFGSNPPCILDFLYPCFIFCKSLARQTDKNIDTGRTQVAQLSGSYRGWAAAAFRVHIAQEISWLTPQLGSEIIGPRANTTQVLFPSKITPHFPPLT